MLGTGDWIRTSTVRIKSPLPGQLGDTGVTSPPWELNPVSLVYKTSAFTVWPDGGDSPVYVGSTVPTLGVEPSIPRVSGECLHRLARWG